MQVIQLTREQTRAFIQVAVIMRKPSFDSLTLEEIADKLFDCLPKAEVAYPSGVCETGPDFVSRETGAGLKI